MKYLLPTTCGHKTFGVKWLFGHSTTHQLSATVDTNAARSPKRFIPQNRCSTLSLDDRYSFTKVELKNIH
jgi:hypothetical protein